MPLHLAPLSRRQFLRRTVAGAASVVALPSVRSFAAGAKGSDPKLWALFSDTHIAADPAAVAREVNMAEHLKTAVADVLALPTAPAGVLINGDCSLDHGVPEDYTTFTQLLEPLSGAGMPIHMTLGNHDDREVFWNALKVARASAPPVVAKHVSIVEAGEANLFLLDSLEVTKKTPGLLGEEQRTWLAKALDERAGKPALVMVHHNPNPADGSKKSGLTDTEELLAILLPRRQVKALIFGHSHTWRLDQRDGMHLINLPAVAYPFTKTEVTGWVKAQLAASGVTLEVQATDKSHPQHGEVRELTWRA